jgi:RNA polymerase sigma-70 factor, ECF subfamily
VADDDDGDGDAATDDRSRREAARDLTVAWLIGIARHKLIDEWRRAARRPRSERLDDEGAAQDQVTDDGVVWDAIIDRHLVADVMVELGPHHRSALTLRYFDGLPVPDVAAHLGRTVEATETLLVRARRPRPTFPRRRSPRRRASPPPTPEQTGAPS